MRQETDRPQARRLQLASCVHISGQEKSGLQARHLQLASCLHFLKQVSYLQVSYLQPSSCVPSKNESNNRFRASSQALCPVDTLRQQSWQRQRRAKPCLSKESGSHIFPILGARETFHVARKAPWVSKRRGCQPIICDANMIP